MRVIERDDQTFLPWARGRWACVIFNLLTPETEAGRARTAATFCDLIDAALEMGGSFYLTVSPLGASGPGEASVSGNGVFSCEEG